MGYKTLEESKFCDTVGYVAIPECVAKNEGDECVARKTSEMITRTFRNAMKANKIKEVPSGEKFFATCKYIGYKNVLKTFKSARSLMSAECGLPGQKLRNRHARNADLLPALLLAGSYDPSSIWFQYFLCKDIDLYCYFFTQGWTQGQYVQYYLYDNLLDDTNGLFAGATDTNLGTIALLGGLGGGLGGSYGQHGGYYPSYGAPVAASAQGRKRRSDDEDEDRKRRSNSVDCSKNSEDPACNERKRRDECNGDVECENDRKRRGAETDCSENPKNPACINRKRRDTKCDGNDECENNRRRRGAETEACAICRLNSDSMMCEECDDE